MQELNKTHIIGYVRESRQSQVGQSKVINFSVVTRRLYESKTGEKVIEQTFHHVSAWANNEKGERLFARIVEGAAVEVEGRYRVREFVRKDGVTAKVHEIVATNISVLNEELICEEG